MTAKALAIRGHRHRSIRRALLVATALAGLTLVFSAASAQAKGCASVKSGSFQVRSITVPSYADPVSCSYARQLARRWLSAGRGSRSVTVLGERWSCTSRGCIGPHRGLVRFQLKRLPTKGPKPFDLPGSAAALYDPLMRFQASNDPALAIDGAKTPTWFITTAPDGNMNVGLQIDLQRLRKVSRLTMTTKTPGFTMYALGSRFVDPPDDVGDMTTLGEAASIDAAAESGKPAPEPADRAADESFEMSLGSTDKRWRTLVLWFTVPPRKGPTVRIAQLKFYDD